MSTKKLQILGSIGGNVEVDATLAQEGKAADAKAVGDAILAHENNTDIHITEEDRASLLGVIDSIHGHSNKDVLDQIASTVDIYTDETEPVNAKDGSVWINMTSTSGAPAIYVCRNGVWEMSTDGKPQTQADWDESDGLAPSYIRNKPFGYKDDLYANSAQSFSLFRNSIYRSVPDGDGIPNVYGNGDEITVIWDSIVYNLVAKEVTIVIEGGGSLTGYNVLGNPSIFIDAYNGIEPGVDSGEPFAIVAGKGGIYTRSSLASHSIVIKDATNVIKLDPKFLPDEALFVQSDWNETDENNGAFIKNKPTIPDEYIHPDTHPASMITGLSAVATSGSYNDLADKPTVEQIQADWTETDESSPAYIKNKPNVSGGGALPVPEAAKVGQYLQVSGVDESGAITSMTTVDFVASDWNTMENKPFYEHDGIAEILPIATYDNFYLNELYGVYCVEKEVDFALTLGDTYKIHWDGNEYECVAQDASVLMPGAIFVGNASAFGLAGNNEPFIVATANDWLMPVALTDTVAGSSHTIGIVQNVKNVKQIDAKYIPIPFFGKLHTTLLDYMFSSSDEIYDGEYYYLDQSDLNMTIGETYTVIFNDVEYNLKCFELYGLPAVGAPNETPFTILRDVDGGFFDAPCWALAITDLNDEVTTYKCTVSGNIIQKVDTKYLYKPNWNENDESKGDYIANKPFYEIPSGTILIPPTTVTLVANAGTETGYTVIKPIDLIVDKTYKVLFDGNTYNVICTSVPDRGLLLDYDDGSARFMISNNFANSGYPIFMSSIGEHTYAVALAEDIVHKIDAKFLPDNIGDGLPEVSTADAGKFLRVSADGIWVAETIPNAEEASF